VWRFSSYSFGKDNEDFNFPYDIAVDKDSNFYVTDSGSGKVVKFNKNGKFLSLFDGRRAGKKGALHTPLGIDVSPDGEIIVADKRLSRVLIYDKNWNVKKQISVLFPILPYVFNGKLYVTTFKNIQIYDLDGSLLLKWGRRGKNVGDFDFPNGIAADSNSNLYISDSNNHRLKSLTEKGDLRWIEGKPVSSMYQKERRFDLPAGVAADDYGYIYLVDTFDCSVRILDSNAKEIAIVGDAGSADGQFKYPTGIAYAGNHRFYIVDRGNNRVQAIDIYPPGMKVASASKQALPLVVKSLLAYGGLILGAIALSILTIAFKIVSFYVKRGFSLNAGS
jgi:DNA-binding beta-propeller fold protein YncE